MKRKIRIFVLIFIFLRIGVLNPVNSQISNDQLVLTEIGLLHTGSRISDVCVNGDVLYALDMELGLQIYNISDPTTPKKLGSYYDSYTFAHGLCYNNGLVFIADYGDKLEIVNVKNPTRPKLKSHYRVIDSNVERIGTTNLCFFGDLIFLASQGEGMEIIDVQDPSSPVEIGNYYAGNSINVVCAFKDLAFIREQGGSFKILNISDPTVPTEIYYSTDVSVGQNFAVSDNLLYIPDSDFGLRIYDISNPSDTIKIGQKRLSGECMKCVIEKKGAHIYAFLTAMDSGLIVLDVTNPQNLIELAQWNDGGKSFSPFVQNDLVYVAEFEAGLEILKIEGISPSTENTSTISNTVTSSNTITSSYTLTTTREAKTPGFELILVFSGLFMLLFLRARRVRRLMRLDRKP